MKSKYANIHYFWGRHDNNFDLSWFQLLSLKKIKPNNKLQNSDSDLNFSVDFNLILIILFSSSTELIDI